MKELRLFYHDNQANLVQELIQKLGLQSSVNENTDWHKQVLLDRIQSEMDNSLLTEYQEFKVLAVAK